jgi:glycerophosphoryl diester phosphodiesterase
MQKILVLFVIISIPMLGISQIDIQGHRGARGNLPENTIDAAIFAVRQGVKTVELDVVITKDQQVIVSHEPWFSFEFASHPDGKPVREAEQFNLNIYRMDYDSTQKYDVGKRVNPRFPDQQPLSATKPLLTSLLTQVQQHVQYNNLKPIYFNIEIKSDPRGDLLYHPDIETFTELTIAAIRTVLSDDLYNIQSFDTRTLKYLNQKYPSIRQAYLIEQMHGKTIQTLVEELGYKPQIISPYHGLVDTDMIQYCKINNMQLIPWTINDPDTMRKLVEQGVDGIITDYPQMAVELFGYYNSIH